MFLDSIHKINFISLQKQVTSEIKANKPQNSGGF